MAKPARLSIGRESARLMLRECELHGTFEGELCPACNSEGKFVMNGRERDQIARRMAGILRHFPEKFDLEMDINGWVSIRDLSNAIARKDKRKHWLRDRHIQAIVDTDPKGRYEIRGGNVRATYAHTVEIELDLPSDNIPELLFYPVSRDELDIHLEGGIHPGGRKWVHLSKTITNAANAGAVHHFRPAIIEIDVIQMQASGNTIFHAGTTVYLTEIVDAQFCAQVPYDDTEYALMLEEWGEEE